MIEIWYSLFNWWFSTARPARRMPPSGEHILYVATSTHDLYRVQYRYYDKIDHTEIKLDHYERTPNGRYSWLRTGARIEAITTPTAGERA
jgi:hypothetical protein